MTDDPTTAALSLMLEQLDKLEDDVRSAGIKGGDGAGDGITIPKWLAGVLATLLTTIIIGMVVTIVNMRTDIAVIQSNRFSSADWILERRILLNEIRTNPDLLRRLMDHERRLDRIEGR